MSQKKKSTFGGYAPTGDPIRIVVLDTNAQQRAVPQIASFKHWVHRVKTRGARLAVPEVVMNELCEHAIAEWNKAEHQFRTAERLHRTITGNVMNLPTVTWDDVWDSITSLGVEVINLDGASATEGLLDQIRQTGAGETRRGVKTGAADSAWIRSLIRYLDAEEIEISETLIVTKDIKAVDRVLASINPDLKDIQAVPDVHSLEEVFPKTGDEWEDVVETFISNSLSSEESRRQIDPLEESALLDELVDNAMHLVSDRLNRTMTTWQGDPYDWEIQQAEHEIVDIETVSVDEFETDENIVTFSVELAINYVVTAQLAAQDIWGNTPVYCEISFPARASGTLYLSCDTWHASTPNDDWDCDWQLEEARFDDLQESDVDVASY